ncbi:hypothetical protein CSOJ01_13081 [Colletotrichum sojae]|uniref:Uncharacterized protein n=1 Tax=Colletotrichum sojae TaxID=2175907 RepID=A0A8H6ITU5_9PEZI|nr:hypothetical protein CSOJ01_13081 [Colletotrichum sojae]
MRSLTSASNTPSGCNNLATAANDPTVTPPTPQHHRHRHQVPQKPEPSRPGRNIRPSSLSPATRNNPSSRPASPSPSALQSNKPTAAQLRARTRTTNNPTATKAVAANAATGPPTATGPRRITATTTTTTIGRGTTKTTAPAPAPATAPVPGTTTTAAASSSSSSSSRNTTTTTTNPTTTTTLPSSWSANTTPTPPSTASPPLYLRRQQPALSSSLRTPLRSRDQNVLNPSPRSANSARAKPSPTPSPTIPSASTSPLSTPTMPPYDKGGSTTARQPGVSSLAAKGMSRAPLTPKVSAKPPSVVTPAGRRRNDNTNSNNNGHPTLHSAVGARDDVSSPAPFIANNITPRSGTRQNRVDSNNSTPNGTPNPDRNSSSDWDTRQPSHQPEPVRRQVVTFSPPSNVGSRHDATESKFFYASDAKSSVSQAAPPQKPVVAAAPPRGGPTFMYANGNAVEKNRPMSPGLGFTPMLAPSLAPSLSPAPTPETQQSKFFYANGAPDLQPGFRPSSAASSVHSDTRKLPRTSVGSAGGFTMAQRPLSPNRPAQPLTSAPLVKTNSQTRVQRASPPPLGPSTHKRKISMDAVSQVASHVGSEAPPTDAMIMSRFMASQSPTPSEMPSPTVAGFFQNQPITIASIIQAAEDLEEEEEEDSADESKDLEEVQSPTKSTHDDPLNNMVVSARRERKVQDLEITNASLEAINRSLERQLRKQTAEIRRYKRLSRSGRLSMAPAEPSQAPPAPTTTGLGIEAMDLSDLSEEEEAEGDIEDLEDSMFESSELSETESGPPTSPKADQEREVRRRKRDEKRLQLDLTKHRELLVDSQKINQSIKRCLNWTEELIKEGKKALEYSVRPSDVELPPRVLQPQYLLIEENDDEARKDDDDASIASSPVGSPKSLTAKWSKEPQDRDSGIELPADSS